MSFLRLFFPLLLAVCVGSSLQAQLIPLTGSAVPGMPEGAGATSITDGTRLTILQNFDGMQWYTSGKMMRKYKNGMIVRHAMESIITDVWYNDKNQTAVSYNYNYGRPTLKLTYHYSAGDSLVQKLQYRWTGPAFDQFEFHYKTTRHYDSTGFAKSDSVFEWRNGAWANFETTVYQRDTNGMIIEQVTTTYQTGSWNNATKTLFTRTTAGNVLTRYDYSWNVSSWRLFSVDSNLYSAEKMTESINRRSIAGTLQNYRRKTFAYDINGDVELMKQFLWQSNAWSEYYREVSSTAPEHYIILLQPGQYQTYYANDSVPVCWTSGGVSSVRLQLSTDNGVSWNTIVPSLPDTSLGFYTYKNSIFSSTQCIMRVSDAADSSLSDQTGRPFTLFPYASNLMHSTGSLQLSVFTNGYLGYDAFPSTGKGFTFKGHENPLYAGGFFAGHASAGLWGAMRSFSINNLSITSQLTGFSASPKYDQITALSFTLPAAPPPLNTLSVTQATHSNSGDDHVVFVYTITNSSPANTDTGIVAGMFGDWDIGTSSTNLGGVVPSRHLVYQYNSNGAIDSNYYGFVSLTTFSGGSINDLNSPQTPAGFTWVTAATAESATVQTDYRSFIGSGPFTIPPMASVTAAFAMVGASSYAELLTKTDTLLHRWQNGTLDVYDKEATIPGEFALSQNFPNPFNPTTTIRYSLPSAGRVTMTVYNTLGQKITELVNGEQSAGTHEVVWNANAASGLYFYRIDATSSDGSGRKFSQLKKMILLK